MYNLIATHTPAIHQHGSQENLPELRLPTSMRRVELCVCGEWMDISLKLESENFSGSIKGRTALSLINSLEQTGKLTHGDTVIESTSGNLGVALAMVAQNKDYRFIAVIDPKTTDENVNRLKNLGAEIELVSSPDKYGGYLLSRIERIHELCRQHPEYVWPNQYENPANPAAHFSTTAPEVFEQMDENIGAILVPVSTGGTLAGISRFFRQFSPKTLVIGVDAVGSVVFVDQPSPRKLTGIGASRKSFFLTPDMYDDFFLIKDRQAFSFCHALYQATGIMIGGSSGATLAAVYQFLLKKTETRPIVCVCPDGGENYLNTIYNPVWLQENGLEIENFQHIIR
ncbi:MAG: pyridoxal-phosphate dependent enzyme [Bacilli bacterium]